LSATLSNSENTGGNPGRERKATVSLEDDSADTTRMGAADVLALAERIQAHARRLENLATWGDRLDRHSSAEDDGKPAHTSDDLLRLQQARRDSGEGDEDAAFFTIALLGEHWAERVFDSDPALNELFAKMRAIEQREGLTESDEFIPDHEPADWKALNVQCHDRFQEVEKIKDHRFIGWLRRHGETDMADLYLNDRAAFDRRREAGCLSTFGPLPDINADIGEGDPGLS
jgi:hypothetical protein